MADGQIAEEWAADDLLAFVMGRARTPLPGLPKSRSARKWIRGTPVATDPLTDQLVRERSGSERSRWLLLAVIGIGFAAVVTGSSLGCIVQL